MKIKMVVALLLLPLAGTPAQERPSSTSSETTPTLKIETNVVLVPVVVHDQDGNAVVNLHREDFQLFDNEKPQKITSFTVERADQRIAADRSVATPSGEQIEAAKLVIPDHSIIYLFDDRTFDFLKGTLQWVRDAGVRHMANLQPGDRVAIMTTTCTVNLDFTADVAQLTATLMKLQYNAFPICHDPPHTERIDPILRAIRRLSFMPGRRSIVFVSERLDQDPAYLQQVTDTAIRSKVVINTLNALALNERIPGSHGGGNPVAMQANDERARTAEINGSLGISALAYGTGGTFVENTNDADYAYRRLATPECVYILSFSPEHDSRPRAFHHLKVRLKQAHGLTLQARRGYYTTGAEVGVSASGATVPANVPELSTVESNEIATAIGASTPDRTEGAVVAAPVPPASKEAEISTRDSSVSFKAQANLVEVPVVVRDREGHAVGNLQKDDFRVFEKSAQQKITKFRVEKASEAVAPKTESGKPPSTEPRQTPPAAMPDHYVAFVFDDLHLQFGDIPQVRDAIRRYIGSSLQPGDRLALITTSGKIGVDFTTNAAALDEALLKIRPNSRSGDALRFCLNVSYFQAVQVEQQVSLHPFMDDLPRCAALRTAVYDAGRCIHIPDGKAIFDTAVQAIRDAFLNGKQETRANLIVLQNLVRLMARMPGQRSIILASPGFFVSPELQDQGSDLIALAIRSKVLINAIDARGVWTSPAFDASQPGGAPSADVMTFKDLDAGVGDDELIALAEGTGGTVNLNNDFDGGVRKAAATPEYMYLLAFEPQNLKTDGSFHPLKVTVNSRQKLALQARRGYWAPTRPDDPVAASKQEIENAMFSRDEIHRLPVEMHTQLVKTDASGPKLDVLANVDLKLLRFRKLDDRSRNDVTIIASLFDDNGNFVVGSQKILQLRLKEETVQRLELNPPITIKTSFDVKPGTYLVRLVARDSEAQEITAQNGAVTVP